MTITARQQLVLDTITRLTRENRSAPTVREIASAMGIRSPNGVAVHVQALRKKGHIAKPPGRQKARGIRLTNQDTCPCCGQRIAKGES